MSEMRMRVVRFGYEWRAATTALATSRYQLIRGERATETLGD
jgi:hypothetical protein